MLSASCIASAKTLAEKLNTKKWFNSVGVSIENKEEILVIYSSTKITKTIEKTIPKIYDNFKVKFKELGV